MHTTLFVAVAALSMSGDEAAPASKCWEMGGAIIAIDSPMHPDVIAARNKVTYPSAASTRDRLARIRAIIDSRNSGKRPTSMIRGVAKVQDLFDDGQILLSVGTSKGVRKGDKLYLSVESENASFTFGSVELVQVGAEFSVARFTNSWLFSLQLMNRENPLWKAEYSWRVLRTDDH